MTKETRSLGLIPEPEELRNDPALRAKAEARMAYLRSRGAPPSSYSGDSTVLLDKGKNICTTLIDHRK